VNNLAGVVPGTPEIPLAAPIEQASQAAWPAVQECVLDGWLLRFSEGYTRRANCVTAYMSDPPALASQITACETLFREHALPCIFRLASPWPQAALDDELDRRGYALQDLTRVLGLELSGSDAACISHSVSYLDGVSHWLDFYYGVSQALPANRAAHERILTAVAGRRVLALAGPADNPAACGLGVVDGVLVGLFDIVVRADMRRRRYGAALVTGLLTEGRRQGARWAYLQVTDANTAARRLYERMGFREVYHYWYRQRPIDAADSGPTAR
jgi:ribosomal protein S18 acetylase RimI-like enzyme